MSIDTGQLRAYVEYFRDLGVYDFYRRGEPGTVPVPDIAGPEQVGREPVVAASLVAAAGLASPAVPSPVRWVAGALDRGERTPAEDWGSSRPGPGTRANEFGGTTEPVIGKLISFDDRAAFPEVRVAPGDKAAALETIKQDIGDCTRCPLAYAGRRTIVYGDGDPNARLLFVGEGPGADEDASGVPFVGKAGQLLNNMISAMGLKREEVYIANVVKCRPPQNRVPEPVEANTCSQFLLRQMDVIQPQVVVALGSTAAMYLLGVKQSLSSLRGRWHGVRGAKMVVTYHPAFLLRDPRQKGEAWADLQMVMKELGLKPHRKS